VATTSQLTLEAYLATVPKPDVEYIDGELKERPVVSSAHGLLQTIIGAWFFVHQNDWKVRAGVEVRTRVSASRVRLPDVVADRAYKWPAVLTKPPLIVIEILSADDSYAETQRLAHDYQKMGIENIWIIDPETRTGRACIANAWLETLRFQVNGTEIHLELDWLFKEMDRYDDQ
jgi:Uma2 family endonuclease